MKKQFIGLLMLSSLALSLKAQNSVSVDLTQQLLTNPDFELVDISTDGETPNIVQATGESSIFDAAYNKVPYGWSCNFEEFSGTSRGVNNDASNTHGNACCWFSQSTFPVGWKLYQTIPADKLQPGLYKVSCMLWVEFERKGNSYEEVTTKEGCSYAEKMGAACLFANDNVQYYGIERDYKKNLTSTDKVVTYANYAPGIGNTGKAMLRPMTVYVDLKEGEDLSLGIRTASVDSAGNERGNRAGWFKTDYFKVERIVSQPMTPDEFTQTVLINNSFELDSEGNPTTQQISLTENVPSGWYWTGDYDDWGIHPNFVWMLEGGNACYFGGKTKAMKDFTLSQVIDAENLDPGIYEVSCRLWQTSQSQNDFGQCRLFGSNGEQTYVQYYSTEDKYDKNLTEGEIATYARYPGWLDWYGKTKYRDRQLHEMYVNVPVYPNQELELGIKSGALGTDGNLPAENTDKNYPGYFDGCFHADYFRVYKTSNLPVTYKATESNSVETTDYAVRLSIDCECVNDQWNTVCFPFSLNAEDIKVIFGADAKVAEFESATDDNLNFKSVSEMTAGVPYLVYPTNVIPSPMTIDDVKITTASAQTVTKGDFNFIGIYNPESLTSGDTSKLIISDNKVGAASADGTLNAFKAYIQPTSTSVAKTFSIDNTQVTAINNIVSDTSNDAPTYNIAGQRVNSDAKGIVIVDGKKILKH